MPEAVFDADTLAFLAERRTARIETRNARGDVHRTTIWTVVDPRGRVMIRSYRGAGARWYREAIGAGRAALMLGRSVVPVRVEVATDRERIDACSRALETKYAGDPATRSMVRDEVLDTTLELHPA